MAGGMKWVGGSIAGIGSILEGNVTYNGPVVSGMGNCIGYHLNDNLPTTEDAFHYMKWGWLENAAEQIKDGDISEKTEGTLTIGSMFIPPAAEESSIANMSKGSLDTQVPTLIHSRTKLDIKAY